MIAQAPLTSYSKTNQFRRSKAGEIESDPRQKFVQTIGDEIFEGLEKIDREKGYEFRHC
jgi:hypothetical protein